MMGGRLLFLGVHGVVAEISLRRMPPLFHFILERYLFSHFPYGQPAIFHVSTSSKIS